MPVNPSLMESEIDPARKWHFSREELEFHTPSRDDGIDSKLESHLRRLYCSFIQELGKELNVHQLTIATAIMFCHRFYMRQSHAKNDWKTAATVCMFLACKQEETPRYLYQLIAAASKLINERDSSTPHIMTKDLITNGERLLLTTLAFNLKIEHPHKTLITVLKKMNTGNRELVKMAWNFVNDWLHTSLCLQYKPHYIAAGSISLAAKILNVPLPRLDGKVWWMQLDVIPKRMEEVIKKMQEYLAQNWKQNPAPNEGKRRVDSEPVMRNENSGSAQSCTTNGSRTVHDSKIIASMNTCERTESSMSKCHSRLQHHTDSVYRTPTRRGSGCLSTDSEYASSGVDDYDREPRKRSYHQSSGSYKLSTGNIRFDVKCVQNFVKRRGYEEELMNGNSEDCLKGEKEWKERAPENGKELHSTIYVKRSRHREELMNGNSADCLKVEKEWKERALENGKELCSTIYVKRSRHREEEAMNGNSADCLKGEKEWKERALENGKELRSTIYVKRSRYR